MATYLILNALVLSFVALLTWRHLRTIATKPLLFTLLILLLLTAVFDSLIIAAEIVSYDSDKIAGIYILRAPIEDFAYVFAAILLIPYLWRRLGDDA